MLGALWSDLFTKTVERGAKVILCGILKEDLRLKKIHAAVTVVTLGAAPFILAYPPETFGPLFIPTILKTPGRWSWFYPSLIVIFSLDLWKTKSSLVGGWIC